MKSLSLFTSMTLTLVIFLSGSFMWAQNTNWAFHAPGIDGNAPTSPLVYNCVDRDVSGNIIVSSTTVDSIQFGPFAIAGYQPLPPNPIYTENAYFAKMSTNGEVLWVNMIDASVYSRIYDLKTDISGNIYVLGNFIGNATFDTISVTDTDEMFLAKYTPGGDIEWLVITVTPPTTTFSPRGKALSIGNDGNVYLSGWATEISNFSGIELDIGPTSNYFIARYTDDGAIDWVRGYGNTYPLNEDIGLDLDSDNNIYMSSSTVDVSVFDTIVVEATQGEAYFLAKFNDDGDIAWMDVIYYQSIKSTQLAVDKQLNQIYVTGFISQDGVQFGDITLNLAFVPGKTMFVTKYSASKQVLWAVPNFGDVQMVKGKSLDVSPDGSVFICGSYGETSQAGTGVVFGEGADAVTLKKRGTYDGFMVKYKNTGDVDWAIPFAGPEHDDAKAVCAYSNDVGVVTGILVDSIYIVDTIFVSKPVEYAGNFYLASCDGTYSPSWIFGQIAEETHINVFPNPASDHIIFECENKEVNNPTISIFSITGQLKFRKLLENPGEKINIADLKTGLYLAHFTDENETLIGTAKFIVK